MRYFSSQGLSVGCKHEQVEGEQGSRENTAKPKSGHGEGNGFGEVDKDAYDNIPIFSYKAIARTHSSEE